MNRFDAIDRSARHNPNGSPNDAGRLARAFAASHDTHQFAAVLRYIDRANLENLFGYLEGCHFADIGDFDRWTAETFESVRCEAYTYLGE